MRKARIGRASPKLRSEREVIRDQVVVRPLGQLPRAPFGQWVRQDRDALAGTRGLTANPLNHADVGRGRHNSYQVKSSPIIKLTILLFRAFFAAGDQHHREVEKLAHEGLVAGRNDALDEQQLVSR